MKDEYIDLREIWISWMQPCPTAQTFGVRPSPLEFQYVLLIIYLSIAFNKIWWTISWFYILVDFQAWRSCIGIKVIGCQLTYEEPEGYDRTPQYHGARHQKPFTPEFPKIEVRASLVETAVYCIM